MNDTRARTWGGQLILLGSALGLSLLLGELAVRLLTPVQLGFEYAQGRFLLPREFEAHTERNLLGFHNVHTVSRPRISWRADAASPTGMK